MLAPRYVACEKIRFSSLFAAGDGSRETSPAAKSEGKGIFSQTSPAAGWLATGRKKLFTNYYAFSFHYVAIFEVTLKPAHSVASLLLPIFLGLLLNFSKRALFFIILRQRRVFVIREDSPIFIKKVVKISPLRQYSVALTP